MWRWWFSDGWTARIGSLTANAERMLPWRTISNEDDRPRLQLELETLVRGFFQPALFLDYIRHFVLFEQDGDAVIKKIAGYHQFHAVREAVRATVIAASSPDKGLLMVREDRATYGKEVKPGSRKAGVVWHTQGSGKSITMACYAGKLLQQPEMKNPTLVVVTDRNDLDGQLFATFCAAADLLKTIPVQASSRDELREMLASRQAGGIIFTTVQKFALQDEEDEHPLLSDRSNIVVISDEAHRSQYGMKGRFDEKSGKYVFGYAKHLRDALKNATFIGFTGTPISLEDKDTRAVFGDYVSIYDIQDAVDDGATVPIFFESRLAKLDVNQTDFLHSPALFFKSAPWFFIVPTLLRGNVAPRHICVYRLTKHLCQFIVSTIERSWQMCTAAKTTFPRRSVGTIKLFKIQAAGRRFH